jgi:hypothetical protein
MIRIKRRNKTIIITLIVLSVIAAFVFVGIESPKDAIQRKMKGFWNIELDSSTVYDNRECNCCISLYDGTPMCDIIITVGLESEDVIELPCGNGNTKDNTGRWKVINTKPDSVFFDVPKSPFHGKYAVRFYMGTTVQGRFGYKIELSNDSTFLVCSKGGAFLYRDLRDWESKND